MKPVRNSIKAVIIRNRHILLTKNRFSSGDFYLLPGGGQEPGETMEQALIRECREEISAAVVVGDFLWVREYIGSRYNFTELDPELHQVEFMFACTLAEGETPRMGTGCDTWQTGVEWVRLDKLSGINLYPAALQARIPVYARSGQVDKVYLGDVG